MDRIKGSAPPGFAYLLDSHANFRAFNAVKNHGKTAVRGWRENTPCWSLQVILHRLDRFELDVDRFNPDFGAWYAGRHWLQEVLPNRLGRRKTDPFAVERGLRKRGIPV